MPACSVSSNGRVALAETEFQPARLLEVLVRHDVRFVVIGMFAGQLWGSPNVTLDLDVCYARDKSNLAALANALTELGAKLRGVREEVPFRLDARSLELGDSFTFTTALGPLDCLGTPAGTRGYEDLVGESTEFDVQGVRVRVAALDDVIRMKRAAGRPKDRAEIETLGALRARLHERRSQGR